MRKMSLTLALAHSKHVIRRAGTLEASRKQVSPELGEQNARTTIISRPFPIAIHTGTPQLQTLHPPTHLNTLSGAHNGSQGALLERTR
jgi:hypothetical protein